MFSKTYCPYCTKAKNALKKVLGDTAYLLIELDQRDGEEPSSDEIQAALGKLTGASSVPRVFIGGQFIGGGDDTAAKAASGELAQLLSSL